MGEEPKHDVQLDREEKIDRGKTFLLVAAAEQKGDYWVNTLASGRYHELVERGADCSQHNRLEIETKCEAKS